MTPAQLLAAAQQLAEHLPGDAAVVHNSVGNLAATRSPDSFVWVDKVDGEVHWIVRGGRVPATELPPL